MRTLLLLFLLALTAGTAHAQDQLTKRGGEVIAVRVVEITPGEVRYRRTDNPDGPLISVWRSEVARIRYANGTEEVITPQHSQPAAPAAPGALAPPVRSSPAMSAATPYSTPTVANTDPNDAVLDEPIKLAGPRLGFTVVSNGVVNKARAEGTDLKPFLTQFGWQFESRLFRLPNGISGLVELVPLVGGLEQGLFLPSVSGLLGLRGAKGFEFGLGPNLTPLGASIVLAMGTSIQSNGVNFPINLAVVPGKEGVRASLLFGFNARRR